MVRQDAPYNSTLTTELCFHLVSLNFIDGKETVQTTGANGGALRVFLNIEQEEYLPSTRLAGVSVLVEESDQPPLAGDYGVKVPVGRLTSIVLQRKVVIIEDLIFTFVTKIHSVLAYSYSIRACSKLRFCNVITI